MNFLFGDADLLFFFVMPFFEILGYVDGQLQSFVCW